MISQAAPSEVARATSPPPAAPISCPGGQARFMIAKPAAGIATATATSLWCSGTARLTAKPTAAPTHPVTASAKPKAHPSASASASSSPAFSSSEVVIKLVANEDCWVLLTKNSDGSQIYMGIVPAGSTMTWTEKQAVDMRLGNPPGIVLTVNGKRQHTNVLNPETLSFSPGAST